MTLTSKGWQDNEDTHKDFAARMQGAAPRFHIRWQTDHKGGFVMTTAEGWASVVASVCASGETADTHDAALSLHDAEAPQRQETD